MEKLLRPAETLHDVLNTLSVKPLIEDRELEAFYRDSLNEVRGGHDLARLKLNLVRNFGGAFYHAFLHGHQGVGKSTELARLAHDVRPQFRCIRFSALQDLNPAGFKPFDVLLVMMMRLVEDTKEAAGRGPAAHLLGDVEDWFSKKTRTYKQAAHSEIEASAGAGVKEDSLLNHLLNLFVNVKGAIKYGGDREEQTVKYEMTLVPELVRLVNQLLGECTRLLKESTGQEWLFVGEDFDKAIGQPELARDLFVNHAKIFADLQTHLIFNIPIELVYSEMGTRLDATGCATLGIPDTPVFHGDHLPNVAGRAAVRTILEARMNPALLEDGQMERLIVASGGNLRDLFSVISRATENALFRSPPGEKIGEADAADAINALRTDYLRRLGESIFDEDQAAPITYEQKAVLLLKVYTEEGKGIVPDAILHNLLRARAVQEFNGEGWYGVHPLVVDILKRQGQPLPEVEGKVLGGTD